MHACARKYALCVYFANTSITKAAYGRLGGRADGTVGQQHRSSNPLHEGIAHAPAEPNRLITPTIHPNVDGEV